MLKYNYSTFFLSLIPSCEIFAALVVSQIFEFHVVSVACCVCVCVCVGGGGGVSDQVF